MALDLRLNQYLVTLNARLERMIEEVDAALEERRQLRMVIATHRARRATSTDTEGVGE